MAKASSHSLALFIVAVLIVGSLASPLPKKFGHRRGAVHRKPRAVDYYYDLGGAYPERYPNGASRSSSGYINAGSTQDGSYNNIGYGGFPNNRYDPDSYRVPSQWGWPSQPIYGKPYLWNPAYRGPPQLPPYSPYDPSSDYGNPIRQRGYPGEAPVSSYFSTPSPFGQNVYPEYGAPKRVKRGVSKSKATKSKAKSNKTVKNSH